MCRYIEILGRQIPSYGLCMTIAFFLCGFLGIKKAQKNGLSVEDVLVVLLVALGMALLGGGLLYILVTYTPKQLFDYIKRLDFSFLRSGGIVFYGGLIGGLTGAFVSAKLLKVNIGILEKCVVPYVPFGHAIGRIGCLLAGCCYGFEYSGVFSVRNPWLSPDGTYFPVQAVEALLDLVIMCFLFQYVQKERKQYDILCVYLILYGTMRFCVEFLRFDEIRGRLLCFSTSQWISLLLILGCGIVKLLVQKRKG